MAAITIYQDTVLASTVPERPSRLLFVTDSLVRPVGYTSCRLDLPVSLAASVAYWRDQTVCDK